MKRNLIFLNLCCIGMLAAFAQTAAEPEAQALEPSADIEQLESEQAAEAPAPFRPRLKIPGSPRPQAAEAPALLRPHY